MRLCFASTLSPSVLGSSPPASRKADSISFVWGALRGTGARMLRRIGVGRERMWQKDKKEPRLRAAGARSLASSSSPPTPMSDDLWLEEVDSDKALGQSVSIESTLICPTTTLI